MLTKLRNVKDLVCYTSIVNKVLCTTSFILIKLCVVNDTGYLFLQIGYTIIVNNFTS